MCLFSACCFHLYSVCLNKASAAESVKSGSQRSHRGLFAQMCCLPTCSRCLRCPPAAYKSLPLRLTAPLRAPRAHTSEPEVLISGTYNTIVCSFPAACHDGRRGTFSFFRKMLFFFWHTINHSTDTQQNCPCDAMRHAWVCDGQRGRFSRRLLFFFPPFPAHHNYSLSVLLYLHSDPSFTFKRP